MTRFEGFGPEAQAWFEGLEADNSRAYFQAHRDVFESSVRGQMDALLGELAEEFGGEVKLFRQNRDVRFSPDKSPYKTNTYGVLYGAPIARQGLYASISARGLVAGAGYHAMARDQLERFREQIDDDAHGRELERLTADAEAAGLELWSESLRTAPRGYPKDHERIALLRRKSLALGATRPFGKGIGRDEAHAFVAGTWRSAAPVVAWLDAHVGPTTIPLDRARGRR